MDTREFFSELYKGCDEGYITLTILPERKTLWFKVNEIGKFAATAVKQGTSTNAFFGVGLRKKVLHNNLRGTENDIIAITALYADIDVKSDAHAQTALPRSVDEALSFLNSLPLKPSIIVKSGNGLHAYWLLNKPFKIQSSRDKEAISSIFKGWSKLLSSKGNERGWKLDNVSDLARVLRVPGSINHKLKNGSKCEVLASNGTRYQLNQFKSYIGNSETNHERAQGGSKAYKLSDSKRIIEKCEFMRYCIENAKTLPEPYWYAMITNLAPTKNGAKAVHELSRPYPKYNESETERKIKRAISENKPHTCQYIHEQLGFDCGRDCNVKSPIVHGIPTQEHLFTDLVDSELDVDRLFSKGNMKLCAFAKANMPAEYAKLKSKLKGKVNLRDFEKAVCFESRKNDAKEHEFGNQLLKLCDINLNGAVVPQGWQVTMEKGILKESHYKDASTMTVVCKSPVVITKRLENFDDGTEKIELSFFRDKKWKRLVASRSSAFNRTSVIKYADSGLPISSSSAAEMVAYLSDYENANISKIPLVKSIARVGWVDKNSFFPYVKEKEIIFESESNEVNGIIDATIPHGNFETWKKYALDARKNPFARFILSASFASPLLKLLDSRVFLSIFGMILKVERLQR